MSLFLVLYGSMSDFKTRVQFNFNRYKKIIDIYLEKLKFDFRKINFYNAKSMLALDVKFGVLREKNKGKFQRWNI